VGRRALLPLVVAVPLLAVALSAEGVSIVLRWTPGVDFFASPSGAVVMDLVGLVLPAGLFVGVLRSRLSRGRVAGLVVELGRGVPVGGLRDLLARALGDPTLELAFASPSGSGFVDATGGAVRLPTGDAARMVTRLERDGELLGVLVHDPAVEAEDPGLVEAVGNAARLALENERLAAEVRAQLEEVRASRERIVETADAERRRIERDLHDGAQQRLVALAMRLQVAKGTVAGADSLLDEATAELRTAIGEVRGLARGVHPAILTEAGLRAAVDALAERTPLPLTVAVAERRYPPPVEATAYFVIAEALTNVARHADAAEARVTLTEGDGRLVVTVADDGRGGADQAGGSGLRGLADRLAAAGGTLSVASPHGGGTILRAELPLVGLAAGHATVPEPSEADAERFRRASVLAVRATNTGRASTGADSRRSTPHPIRLMLAVGAAIALIAGATAIAGLQERDPENGRADSFGRPFAFQVPGGSGLRLEPLSERLHVLRDSPDGTEGISIWIVGDLLVDPCDEKGATLARPPGVAGLLGALRSVDRLSVAETGAMTVDGRSATRVELAVDGGASGCTNEGLALWRDGPADEPQWIQVVDNERLRLIVLDVDGATVAFEIWAREAFDVWLPTASSIVDSIRFLNGDPGGGSG
jgi:signal transduction histidine kinase